MKILDVVTLHKEFFLKQGFVFNASKSLFEKVFPHGKQVIFIHFSEAEEADFLQYALGIRINEVEEMIHTYLPTPRNYATDSLTLVQQLHKLWNNCPEKFRIQTDEDLNTTIAKVEKYFEEEGFAWLERMIKPEELEKEFLMEKSNALAYENLVYTAFRSTALSKLYSPNDYSLLRQGFLAQMNSQQMTPFTIAAFLQFIDYLDHLEVA
ncbi:hypothetical protein [Algoriphagus halophytocola]|uniref:Uncharacterized protein n=1 Tax=Algoriphagus halophytocola TaxID=2991499 RepID=A0ABY6MJS3_9BACT|nr:hypothetical protein [Algoriphagus sp. TR-M5]UZD23204.1 hypothetical protein OM944_01670 [Algoriphagus sp. TR-M5]